MTITVTEVNGVDLDSYNIPITASSGDLVLIYASLYNGGNNNAAIPTGFTLVSLHESDTGRPSLFAKKSDGTEGSSVAITVDDSTLFTLSAKAYVVSADSWSGSFDDIENSAYVVQLSSASIDTVDPAIITASWGASPTNTFFVFGSAARTYGKPFTDTPTGYTSVVGSSGEDADGREAHIATGYKVANSATDDPSAFTCGTYQTMKAVGLVVKGPQPNQAPVIDTPQPDMQIPTDSTVNVDFGATASDPESDPITVTVTPDLPSGLTLSQQGVMTNTGALSVTDAANYTFEYDDGNGGTVTDVVNIEIVAPTFRVDSVSTTTPPANSNFIVNISNAAASVSAYITMGGTDYQLTKVSDDGSEAVFTAPDIADFGNQTANYNSPLTVNLTDGTTTTQLPNPVRVQAESGYTLATITTPSPVGNYKNATGVASGQAVYTQILSGDPSGDDSTGLYTVTEASSMRHRIYDGVWGDWFTISFEAPTAQPNQAPTAANQTFSISENAANGTQIGQLTASDSDGSIVNFSLPAGLLATTSGGLLTLADNSGIVAGTPITATVTFTDNDGATGTATITVNVTAVQAVVNVGLSFEIRDAENSNALIANETGLDFVIYDGFGGTELLEVSAVSSSALGVVVIDNNALGDVGDDVFIVAVRSNGQTVCGTETVIDLDA